MENIDKAIYSRQVNIPCREKEEDNMNTLEEQCKTPVELYRRKIDDNLKILNMKTTNVIQDSLLGVENICNKVRQCLKARRTSSKEIFMDKCGSGDIMEHEVENQIGYKATYNRQDALFLCSPNIPVPENFKEVSQQQKGICMRRKRKEHSKNISASVQSKTGNRPICTDSSNEKKPTSRQGREVTSNSLDQKPTSRQGREVTSNSLDEKPTSRQGREVTSNSLDQKPTSRQGREVTSNSLDQKPTSRQGREVTSNSWDEKATSRQGREVTSNSLDETTKTMDTQKCEKRKRSTTKSKKLQQCVDTQPPVDTYIGKPETRQIKKVSGGYRTKERLGEIEKDYEKVVKSLEMVEQMMASINKKISTPDKTPKENTKTEEKLQTRTEVNYLKEEQHKTSVSQANTKPIDKTNKKKKIVDKYWVNEIIKRKKERDLEEKGYEEITLQSSQFPEKKEHNTGDADLIQETYDECSKLSEPSKTQFRDSMSDLDALIDNAVHELGSLITEFDISDNSSDASFTLTTVDHAKNIYEEYLQSTSSSASETATDKDSPKFEISKSFEELKESFLRENRHFEKFVLRKKSKKENDCTDYNHNGTDILPPTEKTLEKSTLRNSDQIMVIGSLTSQVSSSNENYSYNCKDVPREEEIIKKEMSKDKITEENATSKTSNSEWKEKKDHLITISVPYNKQIESYSKCENASKKVQALNTEQLNVDTKQITPILKENDKDNKRDKIQCDYDRDKNDKEISEDDFLSDIEFCECNDYFETNEKIKRNQKFFEEADMSPFSSENTTRNSKTRNKLSIVTDKGLTSSGSTSSIQLWNEMTKIENKPIDPMRQISLQCKKMISDLVVEDDKICLKNLMRGFFNSELIHSTLSRYKRCRLYPLLQDPDIKDIEPIVHRKMAVPDLHSRMELQIQQTDSFHGFLNLMDKNRRKTLIKHAEKQDHNYRCQMKTCFRKKYPFKVVTASVPANYEAKMKDKKDPEKKYINSLWFSPKDFKLQRNSRIFNEKRLEMYCQSLNRSSLIPKCKCKEDISRENKRASNYKVLVRSGTPLSRRPNTPTRWAHPRCLISPRDPHRTRLRHCDILDDLTMKDLAPFNAEYSSLNETTEPQRLEDSLFFKLANSEYMGEVEETLMQLITPKLSCTDMECKVCKQKPKSQKKYSKKQKSLKKLGNDVGKNDDLQTLSPKAAAQLLIQNIGEIKSKKNSPKSQTSEKCLAQQKEVKNKRSMKGIGKNSKKALTHESKSSIYHKIEENLVRNIICNQAFPVFEFAQTSMNSYPASTVKSKNSFRRVEAFHTVLKIPEFHPKAEWRNTTVNKLFPYINDPENKVFQNITVLPVKVLYENESINDTSKNNIEHLCGDSAVNNSLCGKNETCTIDQEKYSSVDDCTAIKIKGSKKRLGTPRCNKPFQSQDSKKCISSPTRLGSISPPSETSQGIEISYSPNGRNDNCVNHTVTKLTAKPRTRRSNSLGKAIEIENGDFKNSDSQLPHKRSYNPNPWKPSSRIPDPLPFAKFANPVRIKSKDKHIQQQPSKVASSSKITVKEENNGNCSNASNKMLKTKEKCINGSKRSSTSHLSRENSQSQILVNKDKKIKFDTKPTKIFYEVDDKLNKSQNIKAPRNPSSNLSHKTMVDHLCALRSRNVKLQGSIQKAINIIEEKMVDVLSTKDRNSKKKTIERMEKEINNVLKMINEQSYKITETGGDFNNRCQENIFTKPQKDDINIHPEMTKHLVDIPNFAPPVVPNTTVYSVIVQNEERPPSDTKAPHMQNASMNITNTPRKRTTSKLIKLQARPSTVEEEGNKSSPPEDSFQILDIVEKIQKKDNKNVSKELVICPEINEEGKSTSRCLEKYPLTITDGQASQSAILLCPTTIPSITCQNLRHKTQKAIKKMSMKAFGKFADVVKTKTKLIINMTERIGLEDPDLLPHTRIPSTLPVLAQSKQPVISQMRKVVPSASNLTTTLTPFITSHQESSTCVMNHKTHFINVPITEILSASKNEISELKHMTSDRSLSSFSESECFYTWSGLQRHSSIEPEDSQHTITQKIIDKDCLTPFMKALGNLKKDRLLENRHQMIPLEETSPSFTRLMDLLEGLSNINNRLNKKALRQVQLMWNPERRCSFHSFMEGSKKIGFTIDTKAMSAHSIVQSLTSSSSETTGDKLQESLSKLNSSAYDNKEKYVELSDAKENTNEKYESEVTKELKEIYKLPKLNAKEVECNMPEVNWKTVNLELSEIHLISIPNTKSFSKKVEKSYKMVNIEKLEENDYTLITDRYATLLKFFYLIFYGVIYFCMAAMNFTC